MKIAPPHRRLRHDEEPSLDDLLDDPVTHAVMRRDRVSRAQLVAHIEAARARLLAAAAD
jgi:hypothetical protein